LRRAKMNKDNKNVILIVDDEPGFRRIYRDVLENEGYVVLEADNGQQGFDTAKAEMPGLVLLDIVLPGLSGFEVLKKIRADTQIKDLPIIFFSVLGDKETIKKGLELGANDYTVKGFYTPREILSKIRDLLMKSSVRKSLNSYSLSVNDQQIDAAKLKQDIGLAKTFECPRCNTTMALEVIPDYTRSDGHWFVAHFVCPECKRPF
jgi:DNA-binding response OmpR family regulator